MPEGRPEALLAGLKSCPEDREVDTAIREANRDPDRALRYLSRHQLAPLFLDGIRKLGIAARFPAELVGALHDALRHSAARALAQEVACGAVTTALGRADVSHAIFKGFHLGRTVYGDPALRPGVDVDVLVDPRSIDRALPAFTAAGFQGRPTRGNSAHQVPLASDLGAIDLHWHPFRPSRAAVRVTGDIIASASGKDWRFPSDEWTLFLLLVHPAFTDYVTQRAVRAVDLDRWVGAHQVSWPGTIEILRRARLRTAAWATLSWASMLVGTQVDSAVWRQLEPPKRRRERLLGWIGRDPGRAYQTSQTATRLRFSLLLHESTHDVIRSVAGLITDTALARLRCRRLDRLLQSI